MAVHAYRVRFRNGRETSVPAEVVRYVEGMVRFDDLGQATMPPRTVALYHADDVATVETYDVGETSGVVIDVG